MAKKERNRRSARKARARERVEHEALVEASAPTGAKAANKAVKATVEGKKASSGKAQGGIVAKTRGYFGAVRTEMHRVTWPTKAELSSYSVAVIASLAIVGLAIWLIDTGFVAALVAYTNLRG